MRTWSIYETVYPAVGVPFTVYVGRVEARTERSALNKAKKQYKVDAGGIPIRYRRFENFSVR